MQLSRKHPQSHPSQEIQTRLCLGEAIHPIPVVSVAIPLQGHRPICQQTLSQQGL